MDYLKEGKEHLLKLGLGSISSLNIRENEAVGDYYGIVAVTYDGKKEYILDGLSYKEVDWYKNRLVEFLDEKD